MWRRMTPALAAVAVLLSACSGGPDRLTTTVTIATSAATFDSDAACRGTGPLAAYNGQMVERIHDTNRGTVATASVVATKRVAAGCEIDFAPIDVPASSSNLVSIDIGDAQFLAIARSDLAKNGWKLDLREP